jgi:hypothetical protein
VRELEIIEGHQSSFVLDQQGIERVRSREFILLKSRRDLNKLIRLGRNLTKKENGDLIFQISTSESEKGGRIQLFYCLPNYGYGSLQCRMEALPQKGPKPSERPLFSRFPTSLKDAFDQQVAASKPWISDEFRRGRMAAPFDQGFGEAASGGVISFIETVSSPIGALKGIGSGKR